MLIIPWGDTSPRLLAPKFSLTRRFQVRGCNRTGIVTPTLFKPDYRSSFCSPSSRGISYVQRHPPLLTTGGANLRRTILSVQPCLRMVGLSTLSSRMQAVSPMSNQRVKIRIAKLLSQKLPICDLLL
jgi:hypothetical protein